MVKYILTDSDRDLIIKNHVLPVAGITEHDFNCILRFLHQFKYQHGYLRGLYFKRPKDWTKAYIQAVNKVVCFIKYGDPLINYAPTG